LRQIWYKKIPKRRNFATSGNTDLVVGGADEEDVEAGVELAHKLSAGATRAAEVALLGPILRNFHPQISWDRFYEIFIPEFPGTDFTKFSSPNFWQISTQKQMKFELSIMDSYGIFDSNLF
jgi:hypothetical protein